MENFEMPSFTKIGTLAELIYQFITAILETLKKVSYGFVGYPEEEEEVNER